MNLNKLIGLEELDKLNLPKDKYAIGGSAPLVIRGILNKNVDIDILVSNELWDLLLQKNVVKKININGRPVQYMSICDIDIFNSVIGFSNQECEKIIERADVLGGHRFINLEDTMKCKISSGRPKDLMAVEAIKDYIKQSISQ